MKLYKKYTKELCHQIINDGQEDSFTIIINLFIVDNKNTTIKNIFLSTNVALKTWLIQVNF